MLEILIKDMKHFDNVDDILEYITKHTEWIAGFASGEGSFSAYAYVDAANTWGIQFGIDFSISQLGGDRILLEAINAYSGPPPSFDFEIYWKIKIKIKIKRKAAGHSLIQGLTGLGG